MFSNHHWILGSHTNQSQYIIALSGLLDWAILMFGNIGESGHITFKHFIIDTNTTQPIYNLYFPVR